VEEADRSANSRWRLRRLCGATRLCDRSAEMSVVVPLPELPAA